MILERQVDAVWYATAEEVGFVAVDETAAFGRVADAAGAIAEVGHHRIPPGSFVTLTFGGDQVHAVNFDEGCLVVLASRGANALTLKAALRRWPGEAMLRLGREGGASAAGSDRPDEILAGGGGLNETTRAQDYESLEFDSFAEETVMGPRAYRPEEVVARTRVMACTWIQVVEHFGRINELLEDECDIEEGAEIFSSVSSSLGSRLRIESGEFTTTSASQSIGDSDCEMIESVYQAWLAQIEAMVDRSIAEEFPALEARPWRGLLTERDRSSEPLSFSV